MSFICFITLIALIISSCGAYTLSGASTGTAKTVNVKTFKNEAPNRNPILSQNITEKLKDKFLRESRLQVTRDSADMVFEGSITGYSTAPAAITNDQAAKTRLTITLMVTFTNKTDKEKNFSSSISNFADFDASKTLSEVEPALIEDISTKLVQDMFNKAINNW